MAKDLFKGILSEGESLFLNPIVLDYDYQPKLVPYREDDQRYIASCIKPLFQKRNGSNLFIHGKPGVGKTLSVKHVLNELAETSDEIIPIYINCWKKDTSHKIVLEICEQIGFKFTHNRTTDELIKEISNILNKKSVVVVFDEVDKISENRIIYFLLEDVYRKAILLITNEKNWLEQIDDRIRSRLNPKILEFRPYSFKETEGILRQRIDYAFVKGVLEEGAFNLVIDKTYNIKDLRTGLFLLKEAGDIAESMSSKKIKENHAKLAILKLDNFKVKGSADFNKEERTILEIIKDNSGSSMKELYDVYKEKGGDKAYATFFRKINELKKNKRVDIKDGIGKASSVITYKKLTDFEDP